MKNKGFYDLGLSGLCCAGLEAAHELQGKGTNTGIDITLPSTVLEAIRSLDSDVKALDADIQGNVRRQPFLDAWAAFKAEWEGFKADNDSQAKILIHKPGTVMIEVELKKKKLLGWRDAFVRETQLSPSGPNPPLPKPPPETGMHTSTKILIGLALAGVVGYLGYATYHYWQENWQDVKRVKRIAQGRAERVLTEGA